MSMDLYVCWRGELAAGKVENALNALGFEATVLHDFNTADGFWPIEIAGCKAGVEIYLDYDLQELCDDYPLLATALEGRDRAAMFVMHSRAAEYGTAMALAAALASLTDVVIYDPQDDVILSPEKSAEDARYMFEEARKEGEPSGAE